jgi:hypothetical protein
LKGNPAWLADYPALTRAGGRLAFTLKDGDKSSLAVYNLENGETDNLELAGSRPVWSPDGNRIGYLAARETDSGQVVEVFVTDDFGADQWKAFEWDSAPQVEWLPDGEHLLIAVSPRGDEPPDNKSAFYLVEYRTGITRPLALEGAEQEFELVAPAVRPPGRE